MGEQLHLFRMPAGRATRLTPQQYHAMTLIGLRNGVVGRADVSPRVLRTLIAEGLIDIIARNPTRFEVTAFGMLVRARGMKSE